SKARVYDELLERGPLVATGFSSVRDAGPRLADLAREGLVRRTGKRNGKRTLWEALSEDDHEEADAAIEAFRTWHKKAPDGRRSRPSSDRSFPVDYRAIEFLTLGAQSDVQLLLHDPEWVKKRKAKAKV